jgi:hypothetical protein
MGRGQARFEQSSDAPTRKTREVIIIGVVNMISEGEGSQSAGGLVSKGSYKQLIRLHHSPETW